MSARGHNHNPSRSTAPSGNAQGRAALDSQMRKQLDRLAVLETTDEYRAMCAAADAKHLIASREVKAGNGRVTESAGYRARTEASG